MAEPFNPPAFPCEAQGDRSVPPQHDYLQAGIHSAKFPGMTLRDWFAGQIAAGLGAWCPCGKDGYVLPIAERPAARAAFCYAEADAFLTERMKGNGNG